MSKRFNIHDWQAKQHLNENMYIDADEFERENLEFDIKRYIGQTFASWMSPSNPEISKEYAKGSPYFDDLMKGIMDIVDKGNLDETSVTGGGVVTTGKGIAYPTKNAFKRTNKENK